MNHTCLDCGQTARIHGRGLCSHCYDQHRADGTLIDYERVHRPREEVLEEWSQLAQRGYNKREAAARMGMSFEALDRAIYRARRRQEVA